MKTRSVAIFIFDDIEVLDFCGPFEVFAVAGEQSETESSPRCFNVVTVSQDGKAIRARNGLNVTPDHAMADCPTPDILLIPGGAGTRPLVKNAEVVDWVVKTYAKVEILASVCTGALVLAKGRLLDGKPATTHHDALPLLKKLAPTADIRSEERFTEAGNIYTSGGIAAGIDLSLHLVEKLAGGAVLYKTQIEMEYGDWRAMQKSLSDLETKSNS